MSAMNATALVMSARRGLAIERDTTRVDAVTLWLAGWLDAQAAMWIASECRTRRLQGQRVLLDISGLDGGDDEAVDVLYALSAHGCLVFNATRTLVSRQDAYRDIRVNAR